MPRFAAMFAVLFVASLTLASFGHCWPMLAELEQQAASPHAHHHDSPQKLHHHPTEGFGQELSVPGVQAIGPAIAPGPVAKSFPAIVLVVAVEYVRFDARAQLSHKARAGPPAFEEFHARTGRLLI